MLIYHAVFAGSIGGMYPIATLSSLLLLILANLCYSYRSVFAGPSAAYQGLLIVLIATIYKYKPEKAGRMTK